MLGGGNSAGYVAQAWAKAGGGKGKLAIVGDEPVSRPTVKVVRQGLIA